VSRVESAAASWSVVAAWPESVVRERVLRALATALAFALGALAVGLGVAAVLSRVLAQPVVRVSSLLEAIGRGDLRAPHADAGGWNAQELAQLHASIANTREGLQRLMTQLGGTATAVRVVTQRLREASERMLVDSRVQQDAVHRSGGAIVHMSDSIAHVGSSVRDLSSGASETAASILSLDQQIERIARSLGTLTRTIGAAQGEVDETERQLRAVRDSTRQLGQHVDRTNELLQLLTESIESVAGRAERARTLGRGVLAAAETGRVAVEETIAATREIHRRFQAIGAAVRALEGRSEAIGEIASFLEKVMHATRLLGLNASIIASEAGDQGKRFAVVADRVRAMATETGHSIEEITKLVGSVQADIVQAGGAVRDGQHTVQAGERCSLDAGVRLQAIIQSSGEAEQTVEEIASLSREQAQRVRLVNEALTGVRGATDRIEGALAAQDKAQEKMAAAIREVRSVGDEVRRSTEAQQANSQAMTSAVKVMTSRVQSIADSVEGQNRERAHMQRSLDVFEEASKSSVDRSSQIGDVVRTLSDRLEQLERQLRAFQFD
jgi:methyl-accepting chemotaxis protein